jgi:hypothetical protein
MTNDGGNGMIGETVGADGESTAILSSSSSRRRSSGREMLDRIDSAIAEGMEAKRQDLLGMRSLSFEKKLEGLSAFGCAFSAVELGEVFSSELATISASSSPRPRLAVWIIVGSLVTGSFGFWIGSWVGAGHPSAYYEKVERLNGFPAMERCRSWPSESAVDGPVQCLLWVPRQESVK